MNARRFFRRAVGLVVHNWPLKLGAIGLAVLLYIGLVASQDSSTIQGPITVTAQNQPAGTVITNQLRDVDSVRYVAPAGTQRPRATDFRATIDLTNVKPDGVPVNVPVRMTALDPDVTILSVTPSSIQVVLDTSETKTVPVRVVRGPAPEGIDVGETAYDPQQVTVRGASAAVGRVVAAQVAVALDPKGFDVDREVEARPVDANGDLVTGVDVEPATVHVQIPLFTNKQSRTLPVNPVISGAPAPGFRIAAVKVDPLTVTVEGDAEQLTTLVAVDTAPVVIAGATADVNQLVPLAPPSGVSATGQGTVKVSVVIEPVTETRTYTAGLRLDGRDPALAYALSGESVLLTLYGSTADLDPLEASPIVVGVNVAGLGVGTHQVPVVPDLPSSIEIVAISPETVTVRITTPTASAAPQGTESAAPSTPVVGESSSPAPSPSP